MERLILEVTETFLDPNTTFVLKLSRICGLMGGSGPLSFPRLTSKDGQLGKYAMHL
ncbi:hypothetical protein Tco_1190385, partial [Tanacetum coccineum]